MFKKKIILGALLIGSSLLAGCIKPYVVPVQQGNILDAKAIAQLHTGMTKDSVVDLLGQPVIDDLLSDEDNLVYTYSNQPSGSKMVKQRVELSFKNNRLVEIKTDANYKTKKL